MEITLTVLTNLVEKRENEAFRGVSFLEIIRKLE